MNSENEEWDPAFPTVDDDLRYQGITRRDYFAAKAMQSLLSINVNNVEVDSRLIAINAYKFADAMIEKSDKDD